ncbi:MAG TPA: aldehyde ferredoxin oxidoreductase family protein [Vicinamibacterales bacterium]|nr:aldehyde ferredoxin oxidoreductase family protein [Vicinamibacterales bacterium]
MPFGYHGNLLRIDASTGRVEQAPLADAVLRQFIGGAGLGVRLLLDEGCAGLDPLDPRAPLVFAFSPLVGSPLTTSAKFAVVSKSPLTNRINDALASSGFAIAGKGCGCDALVIVGRAPEPSVLIIDEGEVRVESAADCAGRTCRDTEALLRSRLGANFRIASIGSAGEHLVRYATISHDGRHAGRGGSGAVMGAKNLKAIAVRGTQRTEWAHPQDVIAISKDLSRRSFGPATAKYRELGTATNLLTFNRFGVLPTRNFQSGAFEEAQRLSPEELSATRAKTRESCVACTIGCEHLYAVGDGRVRVEYESLFALGSLCGVGDADVVLRAVQRCDELGVDTISTGGTIAFAMECVERGWLDAPWLAFGRGEALLQAIELIGARDGLGDLLAEGSRAAAHVIGHNSIAIAPQVKGLEMPGYEPRALQTMALGLAVGARGADHNRSGAYEVDFSDKVDRRRVTIDAVRHAIHTEDRAALMDSLIICKFLRGVFSDFHDETADMLRRVTGWDVTADELRHTAVRIVAAKQEFNRLAGWTPAEDTLPDRFLDSALPNDPAAHLSRERLDALVAEYHRQREECRPAEPAPELT